MRMLLAIVFMAGFSTGALAWGREGHEVVALIAERQLSNSAKAAVTDLLATEGKTSLAEIANWADRIRQNKILRQPSHTARLPLDDSPYDAARDCPKSRCAVGAIEYSLTLLRKPNISAEARMVALKYAVHLIGDIHQPLHATEDLGGWLVHYRGQPIRLHDIWDDTAIKSRGMPSDEMASQLLQAKDIPATQIRSPGEWAMESRDIARDKIYVKQLSHPANRPVFANNADSNITIPDNYFDLAWPIIRIRLRQAGDRLAFVLNEAFRSALWK